MGEVTVVVVLVVGGRAWKISYCRKGPIQEGADAGDYNKTGSQLSCRHLWYIGSHKICCITGTIRKVALPLQ